MAEQEALTPADDGPRIALVLGGGGIAGYAFHCGVLGALEEAGFDPRAADLMVGTSAGAIAGALLRGGVRATVVRDRLLAGIDDPDELARIRLLAGRSTRAVPRIWAGPGSPGLALSELRKGRGLRWTRLAAGLLPEGRLELDPVIDPIETLFPDGWPDRSLWIPATDLSSGKRVVFGRDLHPPVHRAVAASAALPGFFVPAEIDGRTYVDGGLASPFNLDLVIDHRSGSDRPIDLVVVAAPLSLAHLEPGSPLDAMARALPRRRLRREINRVGATGVPVLSLEPDRAAARAMGLNPMDHQGLDGIIERAADMTASRLGRAREPVRSLVEQAAALPDQPDVAYPAVGVGGAGDPPSTTQLGPGR